jgi:hypothetical protein
MKYYLLALMFALSAQSDLIIEQNIKALYHDVHLTPENNQYLILNREKNIELLLQTSQKYIGTVKNLNERQKNVIEFDWTKDQKIKNFHFLVKSDLKLLDDLTQTIVQQTQFVASQEDKKLRFIFIYDFLNSKYIVSQHSMQSPLVMKEQQKEIVRNEPSSTEILRGTTRFEKSEKEYVREFQTSKDGLIIGSVSPLMCASFKLLDSNEKRVLSGILPWNIHAKLSKGRYKMIIKASKDCDVNLQYQ